ncbi:MAG: alpha-E domain-containing protein [Chitinophagaceae bacterium]
MLSRIADSLFWMNRYMERSDHQLRVIRTNYILSFDSGYNDSFSWKDVITLFGHPMEDHPAPDGNDIHESLNFLLTDPCNLNSVKVLISKARENARGVQDNITKEVWEQVNQLYHIVNEPGLDEKILGTRTLDVIDTLDQNSVLYYGITNSTMPRGLGWNFMNLGKFIERCLLTIDTTYSHFKRINEENNAAQDILYWRNLLLSLSGYELYLKTNTRGQHNVKVMDQIIFNPNFPRSIMYSLERIRHYLDEIINDTKMERSAELRKTFGRTFSKVQFADMNMIREVGLPHFLISLRRELVDFSNQLTRIFFSYA